MSSSLLEECFGVILGKPAAVGADAAACYESIAVEGRHFFYYDTPGSIARKSLRCALFNLSVVGARPGSVSMLIRLPSRYANSKWLKDFALGLGIDLDIYGVTMSNVELDIGVDFSVFCSVATLDAKTTRMGPGHGDLLCVSGLAGELAAGLEQRHKLNDSAIFDVALDRQYILPDPRLSLGRNLLYLASSCMPTSVGLLHGAKHLVQVYGVNVIVNLEDIPRGAYPMDLALRGLDSCELLFSIPGDRCHALNSIEAPLSIIGHITHRSLQPPELIVLDENGARSKLTN